MRGSDMKIDVSDLFDLNSTIAAEIFQGEKVPWKVLQKIHDFILDMGSLLQEEAYERIDKDIWIAKDAVVDSSASLSGPLIIDRGAEIRHCAFIRGNVIVGKHAVVGNSTELKNCILFDGVQVPHFNYVGDSILGARAHMGAGAVTSNVRSDKKNVVVHAGADIPTGLRKMGAIIGDRAEIGCNSVLNPGCIVGRNAMVYPASCVRGVVEENHIWKNSGAVVARREG